MQNVENFHVANFSNENVDLVKNLYNIMIYFHKITQFMLIRFKKRKFLSFFKRYLHYR